MRKAFKLAAMSTIAAVAMVGGSATVASADNGDQNGHGAKAESGYNGESGHKGGSGHKADEGDKIADNICGNEGHGPVVGHDNVSSEKGGSILCQSGQDNVAYNYSEGNEVGGDLISQLAALITGEVELES